MEDGDVSKSFSILIVDDTLYPSEPLLQALRNASFTVNLSSTDNPTAFQHLITEQHWDVILANATLAFSSPFNLFARVKAHCPTVPVIITALDFTSSLYSQAVQSGAAYCVPREDIPSTINSVLHLAQQLDVQRQLDTARTLLKHEKRQVEYILNNADSLFVLLDITFNILAISSKGCYLLGYSEAEMLGKNLIKDFMVPTIQPSIKEILQRLVDGKTEAIAYFETPLTAKNGEEINVGWRNTLLQTLDNGQNVILCAGKDISDMEALRQRKETFVATLTHDLNTPIRAASQVLELLLSGNFGPLTREQTEVLTEVRHSNQFMQHMVESLLTIYKYEDEHIELKREPADINAIVKAALSDEQLGQAKEKHQKLILQLTDTEAIVSIDPEEIKRVVGNLIENAVLFSQEGATITVTTLCQEDGIQVMVEDTGRGIEPEIVKTLFKRYSSAAKRFRQVGTGLSLYLSRQIIEAHGGKIGVESTFGKGSRFFFVLPTVEACIPKPKASV